MIKYTGIVLVSILPIALLANQETFFLIHPRDALLREKVSVTKKILAHLYTERNPFDASLDVVPLTLDAYQACTYAYATQQKKPSPETITQLYTSVETLHDVVTKLLRALAAQSPHQAELKNLCQCCAQQSLMLADFFLSDISAPGHRALLRTLRAVHQRAFPLLIPFAASSAVQYIVNGALVAATIWLLWRIHKQIVKPVDNEVAEAVDECNTRTGEYQKLQQSVCTLFKRNNMGRLLRLLGRNKIDQALADAADAIGATKLKKVS